MSLYTPRRGRLQTEWDKKNTRRFSFKFHNVLDSDIIQYLYSTGNIQGSIKRLVREEIKRLEQADNSLEENINER